jgi:hypothetical protein
MQRQIQAAVINFEVYQNLGFEQFKTDKDRILETLPIFIFVFIN